MFFQVVVVLCILASLMCRYWYWYVYVYVSWIYCKKLQLNSVWMTLV